jgi:hypothetical protein
LNQIKSNFNNEIRKKELEIASDADRRVSDANRRASEAETRESEI